MTRHGTSAPHLDDEPDAVLWQLRSATPEDCARLARSYASIQKQPGCWPREDGTRRRWLLLSDPDRRNIILSICPISTVRSSGHPGNSEPENIMIFGDYDVDGLTATAILFTAIGISGGIVTWKIPHRLLDGYGMQEKHREAATREGVRLIVNGRLGIRCFSAVQFARSAASTSYHRSSLAGTAPSGSCGNRESEPA